MITRREFLAGGVAVAAGAAVLPALGQDSPATQPTMMTRKIPGSADGEAIPVIGLGTYGGLMSPDLVEKNLAPRQEVLKRFYEAGGRLVDTAPSYGNAEEVIGILAQRLKLTDKLFFATKVLERGGEADGVRSFERSLKLLKRDKLELMQCHNFIGWQTHFKTMQRWKENGKFRYIGVTHYQDHAHEELERIIKRDKVDFLQINYAVTETKAADRLLPAAKERGIAVLINRPFAAGAILKKIHAKPVPDSVKPYASSWAQACLKFVLANDAVTCVLPATSKPEHLSDNVRAGFGPLPSREQCEELKKLIEGSG